MLIFKFINIEISKMELLIFFFLYNMIHLSEEQRVQICTLLDEKVYSQAELAERYHVSRSTIFRLYEKYEKTKSIKDLSKSG